NRKVLRGLLDRSLPDGLSHDAVVHEIDRLRKIGRVEVMENLAKLGLGNQASALVEQLTGSPEALRAGAQGDLASGLDELHEVYHRTLALGVPASAVKIDLSIVRGLDYYTGTVYETFLDDHPKLGSICSGGRYDNLAEFYTKSKLPGVGISIGVTRLFAQLLERGPIATNARATAQVLVLAVEPALALEYARLGAELRAAGFNVEVYGGDDKLAKQLKYADRAGVPLAILFGSRERDAGVVRIKDLRASSELDVPRGELVD